MQLDRSDALVEFSLDALEQADMALAHADGLKINAPYTAEQVSSGFLEQVIAAGVEGARLTKAEIVDGHDGMTDRRRWKLTWNEAGQGAKLPAYAFAKATPRGSYLRETLALLHMAENEMRFYTQLQSEVARIAPRAYHAAYYPGGRFLLIMEDLETRGLTPYWAHHTCSIEHAGAVMDALALLHATYWDTNRFAGDMAWVRPRTKKFGRKWHRQSYLEARRRYLDMDLGRSLPDELRRLLTLWGENDLAVYDYWETLTPTVLHGDSHLGNTFGAPDGSAGFFDWQVIFRGHGLRDVAYFLMSALPEAMRQTHEVALITRYLDGLEARGIRMDRARAARDYALFVLDQWDAHMKAYAFGGYGHLPEARLRTRDTLAGALQAHGVSDLLEHVIRKGTL
ncbi:hypothetical protein BBF93_05015 [Hyphomonas sp. CACIAM 19H1]|uniref:phosphotransferase n=1 Tax=Hyphomonas sp. CACIAM 19H1 TaxID=1873716 RepID=UPI000DEE0C12|nr:phosphotransferase [Hyphomonas sp. CACIAM 19H1]AXE63654.1 hypothetical protein BBF93_05015 [Hyphomonas sp. CACIAM 19H1]